MPTTSLAGDRSRRVRNPRDITGKEYARQHAEQQAKQELETVDIHEVQRRARLAGYEQGWDAGFTAGWNALARHLVEIGVLDADDEPDIDAEGEA